MMRDSRVHLFLKGDNATTDVTECVGVRHDVHEDVSSAPLLGAAGEVQAFTRRVPKAPTILSVEASAEV